MGMERGLGMNAAAAAAADWQSLSEQRAGLAASFVTIGGAMSCRLG